MKNKTQIDEFQEIVEVYFKNILKLPCPDFRDNLFRLPNEKLNLYKNMKEKIQPIDLGHLQDKALAIKHNLERVVSDRSEEMKRKGLKNAISIIDTLIRDIDYLFDTKTFDGRRVLGLDDLEELPPLINKRRDETIMNKEQEINGKKNNLIN